MRVHLVSKIARETEHSPERMADFSAVLSEGGIGELSRNPEIENDLAFQVGGERIRSELFVRLLRIMVGVMLTETPPKAAYAPCHAPK